MSRWVFDCEVYVDYFLLMMRDIDSGAVFGVEMYPGKPLGLDALPPGTYISFNGKNYDFPILSLALAGCPNATLKAASDDIILGGLKPWHVADKYGGMDLSQVDHIDLIEVAPGQCGLKAYGGRMHSRRLQDLPIEPSASISEDDRPLLRQYCRNDLQTTLDLYRQLMPQLELREKMSVEYGIDLRSKSDAQIAEAVIRSEVEKRVGHRVLRPELSPEYRFKYRRPEFIRFHTPGMQQALDQILQADFTLDANGAVEIPKQLAAMRIRVGNGVYRLGNGGLHSSETCVSYREELIDRDVVSYYPSIILTQGLSPAHLGGDFLEAFRAIYTRRLAAKRGGDSTVADCLKIVLNGTFGKLGSKWSVLYSPNLMIQVTLSGQLTLLMLIELLELNGVTVVSANTDGLVMKAHPAIDSVIELWELTTGMVTEETKYRAYYARDVNNYLAIKENGDVKTKGAYAPAKLSKNPTNTICVEAVTAYLQHGIPVEDTIYGDRDIRKFVTIRQVTGGATYNGNYLGKAVRWYYGTAGLGKAIRYAENGKRVPRSEGGVPLMQLVDEMPIDVDHMWYVGEATSMLAEIGL